MITRSASSLISNFQHADHTRLLHHRAIKRSKGCQPQRRKKRIFDRSPKWVFGFCQGRKDHFIFIYFRLFFEITNASPCMFQKTFIRKEHVNDNYIHNYILVLQIPAIQKPRQLAMLPTIKLCHAGYTWFNLPSS